MNNNAEAYLDFRLKAASALQSQPVLVLWTVITSLIICFAGLIPYLISGFKELLSCGFDSLQFSSLFSFLFSLLQPEVYFNDFTRSFSEFKFLYFTFVTFDSSITILSRKLTLSLLFHFFPFFYLLMQPGLQQISNLRQAHYGFSSKVFFILDSILSFVNPVSIALRNNF